MSTKEPSPLDAPESAVRDLHTLYRMGADAEPSPELDRRILAAANEADRGKAVVAVPAAWAAVGWGATERRFCSPVVSSGCEKRARSQKMWGFQHVRH